MDTYRQQLEGTLGLPAVQEETQVLENTTKSSHTDRHSDPSLEAKLKEVSSKEMKEINEEKRKSARRKE